MKDEKPNKYNQLLLLLDKVFGFNDKKDSGYKAIKHWYDEKNGEYVTLVEYRVKRKGGSTPINTQRGLTNRDISNRIEFISKIQNKKEKGVAITPKEQTLLQQLIKQKV